VNDFLKRGELMDYLKILKTIVILLWIAGITADKVYSVQWVKGVALLGLYGYIILIRNNYWWNFIYEFIVIGLSVSFFTLFDTRNDMWMFYLIIGMIFLYIPLIVIQSVRGYPFFGTDDDELNDTEY